MIKRFQLYFRTLKHVKPTQLYHQVYYRLKNRFFSEEFSMKPETVVPLKFQSGLLYPNSYLGSNKFSFLNIQKSFSNIDWNFSENGKLWTYNLNYFEFLNQEKIIQDQGLELIQDYISQKEILKDGLESYPISLRGINWIKFLSNHGIKEAKIDKKLYQDYNRLLDNLEYHLLANHLLENGFSLLFGAYYFQDRTFYKKAKKILTTELEEQILPDGAHYELSPVYHQIILHRVLDCINLVRNNPWQARELEPLLLKKAQLMMGWLAQITFNNGDIPMVNDAAPGIAPATKELVTYASSLKIKKKESVLKESGYRKMYVHDMELMIDVGQIAPNYQPGHSHADSLQFVMTYNDTPVIVDTGISTYEKNERRQLERSTSSHNTVTINNVNSSEVWGGFRVARRAKVTIQKESENSIEASHNGYRKLGLVHKRTFSKSEKHYAVVDEIIGNNNIEAKGHLHFHPDVHIKISGSKIFLNNNLQIEFSHDVKLEFQDYKFTEGFNKLITAKMLVYSFTNETKFSIEPLTSY